MFEPRPASTYDAEEEMDVKKIMSNVVEEVDTRSTGSEYGSFITSLL